MNNAPVSSYNPWLREHAVATMSLAGVAGFTNAAGLLAVGTASSHVTGTVSNISHALLVASDWQVTTLVLVVVAFFLGTVMSSLLLEWTRRRNASPLSRYSLPFVLEIFILVAITLWGITHEYYDTWFAALGLSQVPPVLLDPPPHYFAHALSFAMGLQNAMVTRSGHSVVRTTHLTGLVTDIGIETAGVISTTLRWVLGRWRGERKRPLHQIVDLSPIFVQAGIVISFCGFGVVGVWLYERLAFASFLVPAIMLTMLSFSSAIHITLDNQDRLWTRAIRIPMARVAQGLNWLDISRPAPEESGNPDAHDSE